MDTDISSIRSMTSPAVPSPVVAEVYELAEMRHRDPAAALARTRDLLDRSTLTLEAEVLARWVQGLSLHELGKLEHAVEQFTVAAALARHERFARGEALARSSMAISLLNLGDAVGAEREIDAALAVAPPAVRGNVGLLHGLVLQRTGRLDEAVVAYDMAVRRLRRAGDSASVARLLLNRGILRAYQGALDTARRDLVEAEGLAASLGLWILAAMAAHNTGFVEGRGGRLADALAALERAEQAYAQLGNPPRLVAVLESDRCELLLAAGLATEAMAAARRAIVELEAVAEVAHLNEAQLLLARACLAAGSCEEAIAAAEEAGAGFRAAHRGAWAALADYVAIQGEVQAAEHLRVPPRSMLARTRRIAMELDRQGWHEEALHVRTYVGRMALALGRTDIARAELAAASAARRRGTAGLRAQAWHATALLRVADDDRAGARRALRAGLAIVDDHQAALGATELRAQAAGHGSELARLGVRLALEEHRAREVFAWAERWRAGSLRLPPVRPPDDKLLAADLAELRRLTTEAREATLDGARARQLERSIADRERAVRDRAFRRRGDGRSARGSATGTLADVRGALGERVLVEFVQLDGQVHAVTATARRVTLVELAHAVDVEREKQHLLFALRRLAAARSDGPALAAARGSLDASASALNAMLLQPLDLAPDIPMVLVPTGALHGMAWACLPDLVGRSVTVAPSAGLWRRDARTSSGASRRTVLVAGPGLPGAAQEVADLAALLPGSTVLQGSEATAKAVLDAIEGADLLHLAAHGTFRADSPLFSSLLLADGPLTVYDLERLRSLPPTVVLPACDAARAAVHVGDELLGTATALLGLGVRAVIAPVLPVADVATRTLMLALHVGLRAGEGPAAALAAAGSAVMHHGPRERAAAAAFVCMGSDDRAEGRRVGAASGRR